jgi:hypothetical protein
MPAYKDEKQSTWFVFFYFQNWKGKKEKKMKRGFSTKRDALEWERQFLQQQTLKNTSVPTATPSTTNTSKTSNYYAEYSILDMTDFNSESAIYYTDDQSSVDVTFENKVYASCNLPRNRMGSAVVELASPTLLYAEGKVTLDNLTARAYTEPHWVMSYLTSSTHYTDSSGKRGTRLQRFIFLSF